MGLNTLSGRFLILTNHLRDAGRGLHLRPVRCALAAKTTMMNRLERAQIASLTLLASEENRPDARTGASGECRRSQRRAAGANEVRQLVLSSPKNLHPDRGDLRPAHRRRGHAHHRRPLGAPLVNPTPRSRSAVIGNPVQDAGLLIEVTMETAPLREAMLDYGLRILILSAVISIFTATLLFLAVRGFPRQTHPRRRRCDAILCRRPGRTPGASSSPRRGSGSSARPKRRCKTLQSQLTANLRQKDRLAQLGAAVAKVSHDLRNIPHLRTALRRPPRETSEDPMVARMMPKLLTSVRRAVHLLRGDAHLRQGRGSSAPSSITCGCPISSRKWSRASGWSKRPASPATFIDDVPADLVLKADREQLYRVLSNPRAQRPTGDGQCGAGRYGHRQRGRDRGALVHPGVRHRSRPAAERRANTCSSPFFRQCPQGRGRPRPRHRRGTHPRSRGAVCRSKRPVPRARPSRSRCPPPPRRRSSTWRRRRSSGRSPLASRMLCGVDPAGPRAGSSVG